MQTYYHVTGSTYQDGDDLLCWANYVWQRGEEPSAWKWDGTGGATDSDVVSLFRADQYDDAREFASDHIGKGARILTVEMADSWAEDVETNDEGYACMRDYVPAEWIINIEEVAN